MKRIQNTIIYYKLFIYVQINNWKSKYKTIQCVVSREMKILTFFDRKKKKKHINTIIKILYNNSGTIITIIWKLQ